MNCAKKKSKREMKLIIWENYHVKISKSCDYSHVKFVIFYNGSNNIMHLKKKISALSMQTLHFGNYSQIIITYNQKFRTPFHLYLFFISFFVFWLK